MKNFYQFRTLPRIILASVLCSSAFSVSNSALAQKDQFLTKALSGSALLGGTQAASQTNTIADRYIVVLKSPSVLQDILGLERNSSTSELFTQVLSKLPIQKNQLIHGYQSSFFGFSAQMTAAQAKSLQGHGLVQWVEPDQKVSVGQSATNPTPVTTQSGATWGLDRIDSRALLLDSTYTYSSGGQGVHAYVVDTGIRPDHTEFTGRLQPGFDATQATPGAGGSTPGVGLDPVLGTLLGLIDSLLGAGAPVDSPITIGLRAKNAAPTPQSTDDCNGHGTHVAGTIGGTRYGVAKGVMLYPVKTIGCNGTGSSSALIAGIEWVINNHNKPAVMNMSLGGGVSAAVDRAVKSAVDAGIVTVVAAGNENTNACDSSPAREASAITVASTDRSDNRSSFSNFGTCVDLFAPGSSITSAGIRNPSDAVILSGTSMASPHVAGHAAKLLARGIAPSLVPSQMLIESSPNVVKNVSSSPNRMLFSN